MNIVGITKEGKFVTVVLVDGNATVKYLDSRDLIGVDRILFRGTQIHFEYHEDDDIANLILYVFAKKLVLLDSAEVVDSFKVNDELNVCVEVTLQGQDMPEPLLFVYKDEWQNVGEVE